MLKVILLVCLVVKQLHSILTNIGDPVLNWCSISTVGSTWSLFHFVLNALSKYVFSVMIFEVDVV